MEFSCKYFIIKGILSISKGLAYDFPKNLPMRLLLITVK